MSQLHPSPGDPHDIKEVHILVNIPETDLSVVVSWSLSSHLVEVSHLNKYEGQLGQFSPTLLGWKPPSKSNQVYKTPWLAFDYHGSLGKIHFFFCDRKFATSSKMIFHCQGWVNNLEDIFTITTGTCLLWNFAEPHVPMKTRSFRICCFDHNLDSSWWFQPSWKY